MPEKPRLAVSQPRPGTALLQWHPPLNPRSPVLGYRLSFGRADGPSPPVLDLPEQERRFSVSDLQQGATYRFRLAARNKMGFGPEAVQELTTPEGPPAAFPPDTRALEANASAVSLAWGEIPLGERNGVVLSYLVCYQGNGSMGNDSGEVCVSVEERTVTLTGLQADSVYDVRVCAHTSKGPGPYSPPVQVRTESLEEEGRTGPGDLTPSCHTAQSRADTPGVPLREATPKAHWDRGVT